MVRDVVLRSGSRDMGSNKKHLLRKEIRNFYFGVRGVPQIFLNCIFDSVNKFIKIGVLPCAAKVFCIGLEIVDAL